MAKRGELFSSRSQTPRRTYFFNVKENRTGSLFLNVVESKKRVDSAGGTASFEEFERHSVMVFEEDLHSFMDALQEAVSYLDKRGRKAYQRERQPTTKKVRVRARPKRSE